MPRTRFDGLWRHADFRKLWAALTIDQFGVTITFLATQLTAVTFLGASAFQMGLLLAANSLPALLIGLFVGVWVDRLRRRALLIAASIGRAAVLVCIPLLALRDLLSIEHLYVLSFLFGTLSLVFSVAHRSYLPSLIPRAQLVDGNSKLELSRSAAAIGGPGMAGVLIQIVTAPFAILAHAGSMLVTAVLIGAIRVREAVPASEPDRRVLRDVREGLGFVFSNSLLRSIASATACFAFFNAIVDVILLLYVSEELGLSPGAIGLVFGVGNLGLLLGAMLPRRLTAWIGLGPALVLGLLMTGISDLLIPLTSGPYLLVLLILAMAQFMFGAGFIVFNINQVSLRQALTPDRMQGRMNATMTLMLNGIFPIGSIAGGLIGAYLGLRTTLVLAAIGEILAVLWLIFSPVWSTKAHPEPVQAELKTT